MPVTVNVVINQMFVQVINVWQNLDSGRKLGPHGPSSIKDHTALWSAGVPENQLILVAGATRGEVDVTTGPPGAPARPDLSFGVASVHVWPSLLCLLPGSFSAPLPEVMDTGRWYFGGTTQYACTLDVTFMLRHSLLKLSDHMPREAMDAGMRSFVNWINGPASKCSSPFGRGQLMFNVLFGESKTVLWKGHRGMYDGIVKTVQPQPDIVTQAVAGRGDMSGRPFDGSAAQLAMKLSKLMGEPKKMIWCIHEDQPISPKRLELAPATEAMEKETSSKVTTLQLGALDRLF